MLQKNQFKKIIFIFFSSVVALIIVWQGVFWVQCYREYRAYNSLSAKMGQSLSFGEWTGYYASLHMFGVGDILKYQKYKKYVAVQRHFGDPIISWEDWKKEAVKNESAMKYWMNEAEKQLIAEKEDIYGGDTPEETWEMFLNALRDNDLELASKYFVLDKQEAHLEWFQKVEEAGMLDEMIGDLSVSELDPVSDEGEYRREYIVGEEYEDVEAIVIFNKNINNKWKIESI